MTNNEPPTPEQRAIAAYNRMMERVKAALDEAEQQTLTNLRQGVDKAAEVAEELGELTRDEAQKIAAYVQRDLHDAGEYLANSGRDLRSWLRFDVELIEDRLFDLFSSVADRTRLELLELAQQAQHGPEYHSGEITGPGTLLCQACGREVPFHATAHIPPCPICHGTIFMRADERET
jgi:signal transduction histidine kinase